MASMIDPRTDPTPPPDDRTDSALGQRVAAVGWVVVAGSAVGAVARRRTPANCSAASR